MDGAGLLRVGRRTAFVVCVLRGADRLAVGPESERKARWEYQFSVTCCKGRSEVAAQMREIHGQAGVGAHPRWDFADCTRQSD